jgi:hypothetical protein
VRQNCDCGLNCAYFFGCSSGICLHTGPRKNSSAAPLRILFRPLGWVFFGSRSATEFFRTATISINEENGTRSRCDVGCAFACSRHHFKNKNNTAPQGHNLESDQANRTDDADRQVDLRPATWLFSVHFCAFVPVGAGGDLVLHT